jgi:nicotinamidase-related amidase
MEPTNADSEDADPPLARSPELMNREDTAVLVVDAQEKLLAVVPHGRRIVWNIRRLLDAAATLGIPAAATEQYPARLGPLAPELLPLVGSAPSKLAFSACECQQIFSRWRADGLFRVAVCGIETHVCIMQTALDLAADGFEPYVIADAVGARHAIDHESALRRMESAGVILASTEMAMFEWCRVAGTPEFKRISGLAKESPP